MSHRKSDYLEIFKQKKSMATQIVREDKEWGFYAGADLDTALKMAKINVLLKAGLIPERFVFLVKLYRAWLDQKRKAFFASVGSSEISKLGFIQGDISNVKDAKGKVRY